MEAALEKAPKRVLVVSKQDLLIDVVSVFLEGVFQASVEVLDNSRAIETLFEQKKEKGLDLLFVEDEKLLTAAGKNIADFMAPTILLSNSNSSGALGSKKILTLKKPLDLKALLAAINSFSQMAGVTKREYCQIRLDTLLLSGKSMKQVVFQKTPKGTYELVIRSGEEFNTQNAKHFELRKEKFLYLRFDDFTQFLSNFANELQKLTQQQKPLDIEATLDLAADVHQMLASTIPELGFSSELQLATKASMDLAVNQIKKDTKLAELLASLNRSDSEYLAWHSVALCYVSCRLSNLMSWDSANTHYKLSLASFLHDVTVKNSAMARLDNLDAIKIAKFSEEEKETYLTHAHDAAALAREMKDFPGDVDQIIAQHHEKPNGKGFPLGITHTKISPLAAVFIIAHELTDELFDKKGSLDLKKSVADLEKKYYQGYFKRVLSSLSELAKKGSGL
jgi:HD-GYP domain-containing protein (c-di-GMP phosphodiesterase class II)